MSEARLLELFDNLRSLANAADVTPIYWVAGHDDALSRCRACAEKRVQAFNAKRPKYRAVLDGGWDLFRECDSSQACDGCGRDLGYSLSQYGLREEIEALLEGPLSAPLRPIDAFLVCAVLEAARFCSDAATVVDALEIGQSAVALMKADTAA